jgi:hypothetical protein
MTSSQHLLPERPSSEPGAVATGFQPSGFGAIRAESLWLSAALRTAEAPTPLEEA